MMDESYPNPTNTDGRAHEPDVVNTRLIELSGAGLVLLVVLGLLLVSLAIRLLASQVTSIAAPTGNFPATPSTTGPQITAVQPQLLHDLRQSELQRLTTYEWIDEQAGIARIPIDRAMEILAKQGLPTEKQKSEKNDDHPSE